jgi:hypothetical protein
VKLRSHLEFSETNPVRPAHRSPLEFVSPSNGAEDERTKNVISASCYCATPPGSKNVSVTEVSVVMMRKASVVVLGMGLVLGLAPAAYAQLTRTWVSGVGDDVNPCSRTAPCKTFAGAISKTADGGFINALDSGGFGAVTITKSITIDGEGAHAGILVGGGSSGVVINAPGKKVTLRNLSIDGPSVTLIAAFGVRVIAAAEVHVEKCLIGRFSSHAIDFSPAGGAEGFIDDVTAISNGGSAVSVSTGRVSINRLDAYTNDAAVFVRGTAIATVRDSIAVGGSVGFGANTVPGAVLNLENSTSTHNANGILVASGATVRVSNSLIVSNTSTGLNNGGGGSVIISLSGNIVTGNPTDGSFSSTVIKQ